MPSGIPRIVSEIRKTIFSSQGGRWSLLYISPNRFHGFVQLFLAVRHPLRIVSFDYARRIPGNCPNLGNGDKRRLPVWGQSRSLPQPLTARENSLATTNVPFAWQNFVQIPRTEENCRRPLLPTFGFPIPQKQHKARTLIRPAKCNAKNVGYMDNLETLNALLDMTNEAEELASEIEKPERLRLLVVEMRGKAREERKRFRRNRQIETRYELCMIGILEELDLGRVSWQNVIGLDSRLARIRKEIDRTVLEIKTNRLIN